jgi:hypothetical protein
MSSSTSNHGTIFTITAILPDKTTIKWQELTTTTRDIGSSKGLWWLPHLVGGSYLLLLLMRLQLRSLASGDTSDCCYIYLVVMVSPS